MAHLNEITIFNDCIERLHAGQSIEDCLRVYPEYATTLRPMLEMAQALHHANPPIPVGARARVRARVLPTPPRRIWRTLNTIAAGLAALLFVTWLTVLKEESVSVQTSPPVVLTIAPPLSPTPTSTKMTSPTTPPPTASSTPPPTRPPVHSPTPGETEPPTPTYIPTLPPLPNCQFQVVISSVYLRTGPGTGYPVVGIAYAGDNFLVLERHSGAAWFEIETDDNPVWIAASTGELSGDCSDLPVSDQSMREANPTNAPDIPVPTAALPATDDDHQAVEPDDHSDDHAEPDETDEPDDHVEPETED